MSPHDSPDLLAWGLDYLYQMRTLAIEPDLISIVYDLEVRIPVCIGISHQIEGINSRLNTCLQACHDCFHPWQQQPMQIFAVPFSEAFGIDGLCNLQTDPITLLIDVGRVVPDDWLALVAHEYAHAYLGSPGHQADFGRILTHLCLGLGLHMPLDSLEQAIDWHTLPFYQRTSHPLAFWLGCSSASSSLISY